MVNKLIFFLSKISIFDNFFYPSILGKINKNKIFFVDVGAAGQLFPSWKKIVNLLYVIGFEPDKDAFEKLKKKINNSQGEVYNTALSNSKSLKKIYCCLDSEKSSLYRPNFDFLKQFKNPERYSIKKIQTIKTDTIDNQKINNADFLKLDTQGSELDIIKGGKFFLRKCLGIEVEVEFQKIYKNQPLFGDINNILEKNGFEFVDFTEKTYWSYSNDNLAGSKLIFANALYLKKKNLLKAMSKKKIFTYISICLLYNKISYINNVIKLLNFTEQKKINKKLKIFFVRAKLILFFKKFFNFFIKLLGVDLSNNNIN